METKRTSAQGKLMKAAIYCRVSTEDQEREGTSLDSQANACLVKAKQGDYEVPEEFIFQEVWTGATTDRPLLNALREFIKSGAIDAVFCYSTDRLARNPIHLAIIAEECDKRQVELIFVTEPLDNSPEGQLIRYVKGYSGQIEREKIRERTLRGKRSGAMLGKLSTGGRAPFGYRLDKDTKKRTIVQPEADIVKQIFNWLASGGYTLYRVVLELNTSGQPAPNGGKWSEAAIWRMVNNPAYKGETYCFRFKVVEPKEHKKKVSYTKTKHVLRDKAEWISVPDATPAIVTTEVYDRVHDQLESNRQRSPRHRVHEYLFTNGRLRCGVCGLAMSGSAKKTPNGYKRLYRCASHVKTNYYTPCAQKSIRAHLIEPVVWGQIVKSIKKPEIMLGELDKIRRGDNATAIDAEIYLVEKQIADADKEESRYLKLYGTGKWEIDRLTSETDKLRGRKEKLVTKAAQLEAKRQAIIEANISYENISNAITELAGRIDNADNELKQLALEMLDIKLTLGPDGTLVTGAGSFPMGELNLAKSSRCINNYTIPFSFNFTLRK